MKWTKEEENILREMSQKCKTDKEIANQLGRTESSINNKRYELNIYKKRLNENVFEKWDDPQAWALGLLTADGSFNKARPNEFVLYNTDYELLKAYRNVFNANKDIYNHKTNRIGNKTGYRLSLSNPKIMERLKALNAVGIKGVRNPFPLVPDNYKWSFIKGVFDGDGNFYKGTVSIAGRKEFIKYIYYWICQEIDKQPNKIYQSHSSKKTYSFQISKNDSIKVFKKIDNATKETFDSDKYNSWKNFVLNEYKKQSNIGL